MKLIIKKYHLIFVVIIAIVVFSCDGSDGDSQVENPGLAKLIYPENNKACNKGTVINDSESDVTFLWNKALYTDSYTLTLTNLKTNIQSQTNSVTNSVTIRLERGVSFKWFITSKSAHAGETENSEIWNFYNSGLGVKSHVPFPADVIEPKQNSIHTSRDAINLKWSAVDLDNDIKEYEVFFGERNPPITSLGIVTNRIKNVPVKSGVIYNWRIVTKDTKGNMSKSEIFRFRIKSD